MPKIACSFNVVYTVSGTLPMEEPEETQNPMQELLDRVKSPPIDSGMRFSDLAGQVEVLIPLGYDADDEPVWDEEDWTFAKLDMVLPEGTSIRTGRDSSAIISFRSIEPYVMKPESHIFSQNQRGITNLNCFSETCGRISKEC